MNFESNDGRVLIDGLFLGELMATDYSVSGSGAGCSHLQLVFDVF